jgi:hypothetical protein
MRTVASVSVVPCVPVVVGLPPEPRESLAVGVGQEPEAFAFVGGTNGGCGEQTPFRIEPELGKVVEDFGESVSNNTWHVLQHDESRSHLTNDAGDVRPEPTVIVNSTPLSGQAERLTWETGSDEIHSSTPRCAVEGFNVIPDRCLIQPRLRHPFHENGRRVGVPLNVSHGSYPCHGSQRELESSVTGTEMKGT